MGWPIWKVDNFHYTTFKGPTITILRDPVDVFESGYVYMGLEKAYKMDINKYSELRDITKKSCKIIARLSTRQFLAEYLLNDFPIYHIWLFWSNRYTFLE